MSLFITHKQNLALLTSDDDAKRLLGARNLEALGLALFEKGSLHYSASLEDLTLITQYKNAMLKAYALTQYSLVKKWLIAFFMDASIKDEPLITLITEDIRPSCPHIAMVLAFIGNNGHLFAHAKNRVKLLAKHPDEEIRWRCAYALSHLKLNHDEDSDVLRKLALDEHPTTQTYALLSLQKIATLNADELATIKSVLTIDNGIAKTYSNELRMQPDVMPANEQTTLAKMGHSVREKFKLKEPPSSNAKHHYASPEVTIKTNVQTPVANNQPAAHQEAPFQVDTLQASMPQPKITTISDQTEQPTMLNESLRLIAAYTVALVLFFIAEKWACMECSPSRSTYAWLDISYFLLFGWLVVSFNIQRLIIKILATPLLLWVTACIFAYTVWSIAPFLRFQ
jgi:hypothetical protein